MPARLRESAGAPLASSAMRPTRTLVLLAGAAGWRIAEVDVAYRPREGRSKVTGTVKGTARAIRDMRRILAENR